MQIVHSETVAISLTQCFIAGCVSKFYQSISRIRQSCNTYQSDGLIMPTRATQNLIIQTAIDLFNERGSKAVSTNYIADKCGLSRGNLHYHFRTKEAIVQTIFQRISQEIDESWFEDHLHPSMGYMHFMFVRQIRLIWQYRFFYLELGSLLEKDARLKALFMESRARRVREMTLFFKELVRVGLLNKPESPASIEAILQITWLITDQWVPYLNMHGRPVDELSLKEGYQLILHALQPYLTAKARQQQQALLIEAHEAGTQLIWVKSDENC